LFIRFLFVTLQQIKIKIVMRIKEEQILKFDDEYNYIPFDASSNDSVKENGYYMTIRCGLGGIYTNPDEWKDGNWQIKITDASFVIAYSREKLTKEDVEKWLKEKLNKIK
jgi:hypothetical protein